MVYWLFEDNSDSDDTESLCSFSSGSDEYTSSEDSSNEVEMTEMEHYLFSENQVNDDGNKDIVIPVNNESKNDIVIPVNNESKNDIVIPVSTESKNDILIPFSIAVPFHSENSDYDQSNRNKNEDYLILFNNKKSGNESQNDIVISVNNKISFKDQPDRKENLNNESRDDKDLIVPSNNEISYEQSDKNENLENENKDDKDQIVILSDKDNFENKALNMPNKDLRKFDNWFAVDGTHQKNFLFTDIPHTRKIEVLQSQPIKPIDIFNLMVTDNVYNLIVQQTNLNAHQMLMNRRINRSSRMKDWRDTDVEEIKKFLAIVMYMGLVRYPSIPLYWSKNKLFNNRFVSQIMNRNRFQLLLRCLHFADNREAGTDRLAKVRDLMKMLENNFVAAKTPGETIVVDESMVPWRGSLKFRQYNPRKTHKYGIKVYKLCDPSGYTYTSCVYVGKTNCGQRGTSTAEKTHSTSIVMDLTNNYLMKGRTVTTDNYYTSISLAKALLKKKTHLLGTLRNNRKDNPMFVTAAKLKRGQIVGRENIDGIVVAKWKDTRDVTMLSTKHDLSFVGTKKKCVNNEEIKKPEMIVAYNFAKKGVDISDQMASYFSPLRKTVRWYHKLAFEFLLNTSVINSLIIFKEFQNQKEQIAEFRQSIIQSLSGMQDTRSFPTVSNKHALQEYNERDKNNRKLRKRCSRCYSKLAKIVGRVEATNKCKKVSTFCDKCEGKPSFCLECFNEYHK